MGQSRLLHFREQTSAGLARVPSQNQVLLPQHVVDVVELASRLSDKGPSLFSKFAATVMAAARLSEIPACMWYCLSITLIRTCRGKGAVFNSVKETINIPKVVDTGVNLRVSKKGHFSASGPPGDLMVQLKVKPHPYFKRDGSDINSDLYVSVS